jgi:hypothetical protein
VPALVCAAVAAAAIAGMTPDQTTAPPAATAAAVDPAPAPGATAEPAPPAVGRGRIRGVVTESDKRPVGGRLVVLVSRTEGEALRVTSTDEKGRYQFRDLPLGMYEIRLEAEGFAPEIKKDIEVRPPFQNVVDVILRRAVAAGSGVPPAPSTKAPEPTPPAGAGELVQGLLRDSGGSPVVEAEVLLAPLAGNALRQGTSDEKGTFRIQGVPPGAYRLIVRSLGHVPIDVSRVEVAAGSGLSLRLTLVDYALDFVSGKDLRQVQERPRPRATPGAPPGAAAPAGPPATRAVAPEPEPDPLVPPPPEEKSTTPPPADSGAPLS